MSFLPTRLEDDIALTTLWLASSEGDWTLHAALVNAQGWMDRRVTLPAQRYTSTPPVHPPYRPRTGTQPILVMVLP